MLIVISPAKTLDYESPIPAIDATKPRHGKESKQLISTLRDLAPQDISKLMKISDKLGTLNFDRYQHWKPTPTEKNARAAIFAFKGDVYTGLDVESFTKSQLNYAQKHLRMLSGLYGVLRPFDLMQPYRLEMGTKLATASGKDLYDFWGTKITETLMEDLKTGKDKVLINLASNEYFKSVKPKDLNVPVISPVFLDEKNGQYKIISFFAKKARGLMVAYIIKNKLTKPEQLSEFDVDGYYYDESRSTPTEPVFLRDAPQ